MSSLQKGTILDIVADDLNSSCEGLCRVNGQILFVPGLLPGEKARVKITEAKKGYARGTIEKINDKAHFREEPACPHYDQCGGCDFMHIKYDKALELKAHIVAENLKRLGHISWDEKRIKKIPAENKVYYRNKFILPVREGEKGEFLCGAFKRGGRSVVPIPQCLTQDLAAREVMNYIAEKAPRYGIRPFNETTKEGYLKGVGYRMEKRNKKMMLIFIISSEDTAPLQPLLDDIDFRFGLIDSIYANVNPDPAHTGMGEKSIHLGGKEYLDMYLGKAMYKVGPATFFQINSRQAELMFQHVLSLLPFERWGAVWDLYSGVGALTFYLASEFKRVYAVDVNAESVLMAEKNKERNFADNVSVIRGDLESLDVTQLEKPEVVVTDPPRSGLSESLTAQLKKVRPSKIVLISCDSATLARDLDRLSGEYAIKSLTVVDMFPMTRHIEVVALLQRREGDEDGKRPLDPEIPGLS
jgi:23S rRNA (uracil1939-C5)-methyltransferase